MPREHERRRRRRGRGRDARSGQFCSCDTTAVGRPGRREHTLAAAAGGHHVRAHGHRLARRDGGFAEAAV